MAALVLPLAEGIFNALLALLFYGLPTLFILMMVGGLSDGRRETWALTDEALRLKRLYHRGAQWGLHVTRGLLALFLVRTVSLLVLRSDACSVHATHLSAAAFRIIRWTDILFAGLYVILVAFVAAGFVWSVLYFARAKAAKWPDPRRKDGLVVHALLVPLATLLLWIAFGIASRMVCPMLVGA